MGLGDWIMSTAQVRDLNEQTGLPVLVVNAAGKVMWSEVFDHNPRITRYRPDDPETYTTLLNASGNRPYIANKGYQRWTWRPFDLRPGELYFGGAERAYTDSFDLRDRIVIEPHTKVPDSNKSWPFARWQRVADSGVAKFVQFGGRKTLRLRGVPFIETPSFRHAAVLLSKCKGIVTTEGALHHAAAALGRPAVVLWSEYISPDITGYAGQRNIRHAGKACGARFSCYGCKNSMAAITVDEVIVAIKETFK